MSKFQPNKEQKFRDDQIYNLSMILNNINWKDLNYNGKAWIQKEEYVYEKDVKTWHHGTYDVIDIDCIKNPEKIHKEEFIHLPTYMIVDEYSKYLINKEKNYQFLVKTGYTMLDFKFPETVKVYITSNAHIEKGEKLMIIHNDEVNKQLSYSIKKLMKNLIEVINNLKLNYSIQLKNNMNIQIFSKDLPEDSGPLFEFCFGATRSLEIVMIKGLQIDSSKFHHY
jgi:hypothetical protein